jgi:hypothetical protein
MPEEMTGISFMMGWRGLDKRKSGTLRVRRGHLQSGGGETQVRGEGKMA